MNTAGTRRFIGPARGEGRRASTRGKMRTDADDEERELLSRSSTAVAYRCLLLVTFAESCGMRLNSPVFVPYVQELGGNTKIAAKVLSIYAMAKILGTALFAVAADRWQRRNVILCCVMGCVVANAASGSAAFIGRLPMYVAGIALAGLCGSTVALCNATVMELTGSDKALRKKYSAYLRASNQAFGIALSPLGGLIALTGLWVPYYVSAVVGLVAFAMAFAFLQASRSADASSPPPIRRADRDFRASRAPCLDWLILLCAVNRAATAIQYIIPLLCLPSLLSEPSFDTGDPALIGENLARRQLARALGMIAIPFGVASLYFQTAGYLALSSRASDTILCCSSQGFVCLGFLWASRAGCMWELAFAQGLIGVGAGLYTAAFGQMPQEYIWHRHRQATSQAFGCLRIGTNVGQVLGPYLVGHILDSQPLSYRWMLECAAGVAMLKSVTIPLIALLIQRRVGNDAEATGSRATCISCSARAERPNEVLRPLLAALGWRYLATVIFQNGLNSGIGGRLLSTANDYFLLDTAGMSSAQQGQLMGFCSLPWQMKSLLGLLSDTRPVAGYRRSPYLFAAGSLGVVSHLALYGLPLALLDGSVLLVCLLMASNLSGAAADVVVDASIAEQTRQHPTLAANLQVKVPIPPDRLHHMLVHAPPDVRLLQRQTQTQTDRK